MLNFGTALSGLRASQVAINTISNNIANANTPGYSRQTVSLVDRFALNQRGILVGNGVTVSGINRIASASIQSAIVENTSLLGTTQTSLGIARGLESILSPSAGSIGDGLQAFFDSAQNLQSRPGDPVERTLFLKSAEALANEFNNSAHALERLSRDSKNELKQAVTSLNSKLSDLFETNRQISIAEARGLAPNDLHDRHQQQLQDISSLVEISAQQTSSGFDYQISNYSINRADIEIEATFDDAGKLSFRTDSGFEIRPEAGALAGYQEQINSTIPIARKNLDNLARAFMSQVDQIQATGLNGSNRFEHSTSRREVSDIDGPLSESVQPMEIQSGELFVSITNKATGERVSHRIDIDAENQSLRDIANEISGLDGIQAIVGVQTANLSVIARPGFEFDFSGQLPTSPDRTNISGNAEIAFSGQYSGLQNGKYNFEVSGSGFVGVTEDLNVIVRNEFGETVDTINIGSGYEPGEEIELDDGVYIAFDSGSIGGGDTFSVDLVNDSDTSQILSAIGLNTLFEGVDGASISLNSEIQDDPGQVALSRNGDLGDASNAERLFKLREQAVFDGDRNYSQQFAHLQSVNGIEVNQLANRHDAQQQALNRLANERDSISGVDQNEELVRMLQFQESFQASVRVISAIDEMMTELLNAVR